MEFQPFAPTTEQMNHNPNKTWEGFLGKNVKKLNEKLKEVGSVSDERFLKLLDNILEEVPEKNVNFISRDESIIRVLELDLSENNGFSHEGLQKAYLEKKAFFIANKLSHCEFETVEDEWKKQIIGLQKSGVFDNESLEKMKELFLSTFQ